MIHEYHEQEPATCSQVNEDPDSVLEYCISCDTTHRVSGPFDDSGIERTHIRRRDGSCVISLNGQGHLPCGEHNG